VVIFRPNVKSAVFIHHLFVSPGHNFFGRHGLPPGAHAMTDLAVARCRAGRGIEGDRFFGYRPDYAGQVTFFAWEVYADVKQALAVPELRPDAFRRNVVVAGPALNDLIGTRFTLGGVEFEGMSEAKPCHWMDRVVAPGAERWLRGRGGLRARVLSDGELHRGPVELLAPGLLALH
jgi:hypothetical protein